MPTKLPIATRPAHAAEATRPRAVRSLRAPTCASSQTIIAANEAVDDLTLAERAGIGAERLPQVFWGRAQSRRCASLEARQDISDNGRMHRAGAELAHLSEEPAHAA